MVTVHCNVQATNEEILAKKQSGLKALNERTVANRPTKLIETRDSRPVRNVLCDEPECDDLATFYCTHCVKLHCHDHTSNECRNRQPTCLHNMGDVLLDCNMSCAAGEVRKGYKLFAKWSGMTNCNPLPVVAVEHADKDSQFIKVLT